jgi:hypothetical protein
MAAAAVDMREAQGERFDASRWTDAVESFDRVRSDVAIRKEACAKELGLESRAALILPPRLLEKKASQ